MLTQFYMMPGTCCTGIHILLEECALVDSEFLYQVNHVDLMAGDQHKDEYLAINPNGTIPALVCEDGTALTDFQTIAWWLAKNFPEAELLPGHMKNTFKAIDVMNFVISTMHKKGFVRIYPTDNVTCRKTHYEHVKQQGSEVVERGFKALDRVITGSGYVTETFSIADAALFIIEFWAEKLNIPMPANLSNHYSKMLQRQSVQQVLLEECSPVVA